MFDATATARVDAANGGGAAPRFRPEETDVADAHTHTRDAWSSGCSALL